MNEGYKRAGRALSAADKTNVNTGCTEAAQQPTASGVTGLGKRKEFGQRRVTDCTQ
jgi:hypothetical protein